MRALKVGFVGLLFWFGASSFSEVQYEWSDQRMQFWLPDFFVKEKSSDIEFLARGNEMTFHLMVYMEDIIAENKVSSFVAKMGNEKFGLVKSDGEGTIEGNGYKGHYIYGSVNGKLIYVVALIDLNSGLGYFGKIAYNTVDNADPNVAQRILKSFKRAS